MDNLKQKVAKGAIWVLCEKLSCQAVGFVVGMILARLLTPDDYGTVALLTIFTSIAGVFVDSGFGQALIQKKDANQLDYNSVFYLSLLLSGLMYLILFFIAPLVADFYEIPELKPILRVISVVLICNSINSIQNAELNRKLLFHLSFRISLISTISSAIVGISMAFLGYGVWALVASGVVSGVVGVISRWLFIAWRPKFMFSLSALKPLFRYGWKMTVSGLLDVGFNNLSGLIIGKWYSCADLAFVNKGRHLPQLLMENINGTLGRVAFPALSQIQDEMLKVRESMRRMMICSTYFVFPLMTLMAITAYRTILLLYGDQWVSATPYAQIACFSFALWPFHTINLQGIMAIGHSDVFLKLEILKKILALIVLVVCIPQGVLIYVACSSLVLGPVSVFINAWPNRKLLDYTIGMQLKDVLPTILLSITVAIPVWLLGLFFTCNDIISLFVCLILQGVLMLSTYLVASIFFKFRPVREVCLMLKSRMENRNRMFVKLTEYLEV